MNASLTDLSIEGSDQDFSAVNGSPSASLSTVDGTLRLVRVETSVRMRLKHLRNSYHSPRDDDDDDGSLCSEHFKRAEFIRDFVMTDPDQVEYAERLGYLKIPEVPGPHPSPSEKRSFCSFLVERLAPRAGSFTPLSDIYLSYERWQGAKLEAPRPSHTSKKKLIKYLQLILDDRD